jgi:hypothetical protein
MSNVIYLDISRRPRRPEGDIDCQIRQEDLEDLKIRKQRRDAAFKHWKRLNDRIPWMKLNDYPVAPGVPHVIPVNGSSYHVNRRPYFRLRVD